MIDASQRSYSAFGVSPPAAVWAGRSSLPPTIFAVPAEGMSDKDETILTG